MHPHIRQQLGLGSPPAGEYAARQMSTSDDASPAQPAAFHERARELVSAMTLEEKAALCSGRDFWTTKPIERLGLGSICLTDGPHGVRKAAGTDFTNSAPATCFPTASALACSWDVALLREVGEALGREARAQDVQVLLGPGLNMKRSPLCGRNFEYFSEDPTLAGKLAAAHVAGVQSQGVGASLKHFAANNQEYERTTTNSNVDERTLHEIYLRAFEIAVRESAPWTVMSAYNQVAGVFASEHPLLLDEVLRKRWGFEGAVVSDWGAVNDRVAGIRAGLHLEMPSSQGENDRRIVEAVRRGELPEARLDQVVVELTRVLLCALARRDPSAPCDLDRHHALARRAAAESMVLLSNQNFFPLDPRRPLRVALIGQFAKTPRYQGAGSSQIRPTRVSDVYSALVALTEGSWQTSFAPGYLPDGSTNDALIQEATRQARGADLALVFAGLPDSFESEGFDRKDLSLASGHERLIETVAGAQPNTGVVLMNGSAVSMPWAGGVRAILEAWLAGQAGGEALADAIIGRINPSGKLSETFPLRLEDTPAFLDFPGREGEARYGERVFIGYRYYERRRITPLFPFGHGLSYTSFKYSDLELVPAGAADAERGVLYTASVTVKNTGGRAGQEIVQLYVGEEQSRLLRPPKELRHFAKLALEAGESRSVSFELGHRDFAYYDVRVHDWVADRGRFTLFVGGSSAGPFLTWSVRLDVERPYPPLSRESRFKDFAEHPRARGVYRQELDALIALFAGTADASADTPEQRKARDMAEAFLSELPLWKLPMLSQGKFSEADVEALLARVR
ncbi:MAG TPA: glycoside hydrolase family 3 C-terminal domain-containing protein [Polyangiaceae bacterium]|nr:glycoside hydrolase family 3 C-terminal domain-containing protein [Polyangiaceae bacterium]